MPCACKKTVEKYPDNITWGPLVWRILHGLAERSGRQTALPLQDDERRYWTTLLKVTAQVLPCDVCRTHYSEWLRINPCDPILSVPYNGLNLWIRTWLFNLHNNVNSRTSKGVFLFEGLSETYGRVEIKPSWRQLEPIMNLAINLSGISLMPWRKWLGTVRSLQGFYGI